MERRLTHLSSPYQQSRSYSPAVISEGGRIVWLSGHLASENEEGESLKCDFDGQVKCIFDKNGYIFIKGWYHGRWKNDFCSSMSHFHCLLISHTGNSFCLFYNIRIRGKNSINIGPDFNHFCIQCCTKDGSSII